MSFRPDRCSNSENHVSLLLEQRMALKTGHILHCVLSNRTESPAVNQHGARSGNFLELDLILQDTPRHIDTRTKGRNLLKVY